MTDKSSAQASVMDIIAQFDQEGTQAVVQAWLKKSGEAVVKDEPIVELETDKVVVEVSAPCNGILQILMNEGDDAEPGALLGRIDQTNAETLHAKPSFQAGENAGDINVEEHNTDVAEGNTNVNEVASNPEQRLSPAVRRLLAEHELDPSSFKGSGTGRRGRLTRDDVVRAIAEREDSGTQVPHSSLRRKIAKHMQSSLSTAPHVTSVFEADFTAVIAHRAKHKAAFAKQGANLTLTAYLVAAAAQAMQAAPEANSRWHEDYLEFFRDINIGIAAALGDKGLIVPVIHQVQKLSLLGIACRLQEITESARDGTLKPADVQGGTFTISNHGVSGSLFAAPIIINQPQSAILGVGAVEKRVVVTELEGVDAIQVRARAYVSLTIDHRVLDGSQANAWLRRFVELLQLP